jgi:hypothetical protein
MSSARNDSATGAGKSSEFGPRPDGLAIGDTHAFADGVKVRVSRLGLLPNVPQKTMFEDDRYLDSEAVRFEVAVTNDGDKCVKLGELETLLRSGPEGRPGDESWSGTTSLRGKLLPGGTATGTYTYRVIAGTVQEIDIEVSRRYYHGGGDGEQVWSGAALPGVYSDAGPDKERLTQEQRDELFAEAIRDLDAMTGLAPVKQRIRLLAARARMSSLRARHGLPDAGAVNHLVFLGPPGTGKTTVARIVGKIFAGTGVLERGHVVEAHRVDLIGEYVGSTAVKTNKLIDTALDGVLFVDEAYGLHGHYGGGADAFCDEALQVLLKRAEDDRHRLVVILAGYRAEMMGLLAANPGLASRFAVRVNFPSYSSDELLTIARAILDKSADKPDDEAVAEMRRCCTTVETNGWADVLGNGRFVRMLCESTRAARDLRLTEEYGDGEPLVDQLTMLRHGDVRAAFTEICDGHGLRYREEDGRVRRIGDSGSLDGRQKVTGTVTCG